MMEIYKKMKTMCKSCLYEDYDWHKEPCNSCNGNIFGKNNDECNEWQPRVVNGLNTVHKKTGTTEEAKHYQIADIQPIEIMQKYLTKEEFVGAMKMQVIKYVLRIGHKNDGREDAGKCAQYAKWMCEAMDGKTIVPGGK